MVQSYPPNNRGYTPTGARPAGRPTRLIPDLRPGENLVLLQRQHPGVLLRKLLGPALLLGLWVASLALVSSKFDTNLELGTWNLELLSPRAKFAISYC